MIVQNFVTFHNDFPSLKNGLTKFQDFPRPGTQRSRLK